MWWAWPLLRRFWAGVGTVTAGLLVTWLYSLLSEQALPHLRIASTLLHNYWPWLGAGLLALTAASIVAERAHRQHATRAPQPLRVARRSWRERFKRPPPPIVPAATSASTMVGRKAELARLNEWFAQVRNGTRRVIFVSGEAGIGKTTLTRAFLESAPNHQGVRIGRGQCVEQYGAGEPYMPILEALTRLCREPGGENLVEILHRMAPAWLAQMPSLISAEDRARLQSLAQGTTQQRMLREMAEALEVIAPETPLVLFIEDLHWSDPSTLDLIATVARRNEPARLMILGTYRPVEMLAGEHPLRAMKEELELHQQAIELRLPLLSEPDVAAYVTQRFNDDKEKIAAAVYARSEGNPLFMVNVVDYLVEQGSVANADKIEAPRNIRQMIERNLQRLSPDEQRVLEAASVAGAEFSAAAVAAALERPITEIETCCARLARSEQFVNQLGPMSWPDGTVASGFRFSHALYQEVLSDRLPAARQVELHKRIAERQEAGYGERSSEIAAELAHHFGRCGDQPKTLKYLEIAGQRALDRRAYREGERHYREALATLQNLPESAERDTRELGLWLAMAGLLQATMGFASAGTADAYARARALADRAGDVESLQLIFGMWSTIGAQGDLRAAVVLGEQMQTIASRINSSAALASAHYAQGLSYHLLGRLDEARKHLEQCIPCCRAEDFRGSPNELGVNARFWAGTNEWFLGYPDRGMRHLDDAFLRARRLNKPFSLAFASSVGAYTYCMCGDFKRALIAAEEASRLGAEFGFPLFEVQGNIGLACARAKLGQSDDTVRVIQESIAKLDDQKFYLARTWILCMLSETQALAGALNDALVTIDQAVRTNPDELLYLSLAFRSRGELRLRDGARQIDHAEQDFREAISLAQKTSAKALELRATTSLARLLRDTGRRDEARTMLAEIYSWFTEGFDTRDLKDAKSLLYDLGADSPTDR
jgi:tetratricopeptide (TPR) repeat protein